MHLALDMIVQPFLAINEVAMALFSGKILCTIGEGLHKLTNRTIDVLTTAVDMLYDLLDKILPNQESMKFRSLAGA